MKNSLRSISSGGASTSNGLYFDISISTPPQITVCWSSSLETHDASWHLTSHSFLHHSPNSSLTPGVRRNTSPIEPDSGRDVHGMFTHGQEMLGWSFPNRKLQFCSPKECLETS